MSIYTEPSVPSLEEVRSVVEVFQWMISGQYASSNSAAVPAISSVFPISDEHTVQLHRSGLGTLRLQPSSYSFWHGVTATNTNVFSSSFARYPLTAHNSYYEGVQFWELPSLQPCCCSPAAHSESEQGSQPSADSSDPSSSRYCPAVARSAQLYDCSPAIIAVDELRHSFTATSSAQHSVFSPRSISRIL